MPVLVAPRELSDLVYRCARTAGVDPGRAKRIAQRWLDAAIAAAGSDALTAARSGLPVEPAVFASLCHRAGAFLVSEHLIDDIDVSEFP